MVLHSGWFCGAAGVVVAASRVLAGVVAYRGNDPCKLALAGLAVSHPCTGHNRGLATARRNTCGAAHRATGGTATGPAAVAAGQPTAQ